MYDDVYFTLLYIFDARNLSEYFNGSINLQLIVFQQHSLSLMPQTIALQRVLLCLP